MGEFCQRTAVTHGCFGEYLLEKGEASDLFPTWDAPLCCEPSDGEHR